MEKSVTGIAVIFDMDGVLVDTEPLHARIASRTAREAGLALEPSDFDRYVGIPDREMWADIRRRFPTGERGADLERRQRALTLAEFGADPPEPVAGIPELLEELTRAGVALGLASSSERELIERILEGTGLRRFFRVVAGRDEVARGKPAPDLYLTVCRQLGIDSRRATAIEDSVPGLEAAAGAGCRTVAYAPGGPTHAPNFTPDLTVASFNRIERERILALAGTRRGSA